MKVNYSYIKKNENKGMIFFIFCISFELSKEKQDDIHYIDQFLNYLHSIQYNKLNE